MAPQPDSSLAATVLPGPLYEALVHVYAQGVAGSMLVGGLALAGYYAGHRRSDDLDLFARDANAMRATVLAVESLRREGVSLTRQQNSKQFYSALCRSREHPFTIRVVLDGNLFEVGHLIAASDGVQVADLETLLKTKAAALLSRCSEKELHDLRWLFGQFPDRDVRELIPLGREIDVGMDAEALLISLVGTPLDRGSCGFSLSQSGDEVFADISTLKQRLLSAFEKVARNQPAPPVGELIQKLRE